MPNPPPHSIVGASLDDVIKGSRLGRHMKDAGREPSTPDDTSDVVKDVDISEGRIAKIKHGKRLSKRFTWPGADWDAAVIVLTEEEIERCRLTAADRLEQYQKRLGVNWHESLIRETTIEMLALALVDPDDGSPIAMNAAELRAYLTQAEIDYLMDIYDAWQTQVAPLSSAKVVPDHELAALQEEIKKACAGLREHSNDTGLLKVLMWRMVCHVLD